MPLVKRFRAHYEFVRLVLLLMLLLLCRVGGKKLYGSRNNWYICEMWFRIFAVQFCKVLFLMVGTKRSNWYALYYVIYCFVSWFFFVSRMSIFSDKNELMYVLVKYRYRLFTFKILMSMVYKILVNFSRLVELYTFLESRIISPFLKIVFNPGFLSLIIIIFDYSIFCLLRRNNVFIMTAIFTKQFAFHT